MGRQAQGVGDGAGRYLVVPRVLCLVTHGDDVLLLRGAPDKRIWPNLYNGVGGHVEPGEDVRAAALREIAEETGLEVTDLRLRGVVNIFVEADHPGVLMFLFTARARSRQVRSSAEGALVWAPVDRIERFDLVEDLPVILPRALAMAPHAAPFFAHYSYDEQDRLVIRLK